MNWIDWLVIGLLLIGLVQGLIGGWQAAFLGAFVLVLAYVGASALHPFYAEGVGSLPMQADWARTIAFVIVLVGLYIILTLFVNTLRGARRPRVETQVPGAVVGLIRGAVAAVIVLGVLVASPPGDALRRDIIASRLGGPLLVWQRAAMRLVNQRFPSIPPIGFDRKL